MGGMGVCAVQRDAPQLLGGFPLHGVCPPQQQRAGSGCMDLAGRQATCLIVGQVPAFPARASAQLPR